MQNRSFSNEIEQEFENYIQQAKENNLSREPELRDKELKQILLEKNPINPIIEKKKVTFIDVNKNIKLSGFTSWVGKTSSEVTMKLEQEIADNKWFTYLDAKFIVCARDANNKDPGIMNPLEITDEKEKAIFDLGESEFYFSCQVLII